MDHTEDKPEFVQMFEFTEQPSSSKRGSHEGDTVAARQASLDNNLDGLSSLSELTTESEQSDDGEVPLRKRGKAMGRRSKTALRLQTNEKRRVQKRNRKAVEQTTQDAEEHGWVINSSRKSDQEAIHVHMQLSNVLKEHQVEGIRFLWDNIIDPVNVPLPTPPVTDDDNKDRKGCVLAHSMGLGKTLQVITFFHTLQQHSLLKQRYRSLLIIAPVSTLHGWRDEFRKWWPKDTPSIHICLLDEQKDNNARARLLKRWHDQGGVCILGFEMFTWLARGNRLGPALGHKIRKYLQRQGPDLLVVDEAHLLSNFKTHRHQAVSKIRTRSRVLLTGTPLQNNLSEYYSMMELISPGLFGSRDEFEHFFIRNIEAGQFHNSTSKQRRKMNARLSVLNQIVSGMIQRRTLDDVTQDDLPEKHEFVVKTRMSEAQFQLYELCLKYFVSEIRKGGIMRLWRNLMAVWNHPPMLMTSRAPNVTFKGLDQEAAREARVEAEATSSLEGQLEVTWWGGQTIPPNTYGGKMVVAQSILQHCLHQNDKVIFFSQSLAVLDFMQQHLTSTYRFQAGVDFYRLQGGVSAKVRQEMCVTFNQPASRPKVFLVSVQAGSTGMNMFGANRVILFDVSWNPAQDNQAVCRAWRYGQSKPVYVYRLVAVDTMEERIHKRQISKHTMFLNVVDKASLIHRVSQQDIQDFFTLPNAKTLYRPGNQGLPRMVRTQSSEKPEIQDPLLESIMKSDKGAWVHSIAPFSAAMEDDTEELDEAEAMHDYEQEMYLAGDDSEPTESFPKTAPALEAVSIVDPAPDAPRPAPLTATSATNAPSRPPINSERAVAALRHQQRQYQALLQRGLAQQARQQEQARHLQPHAQYQHTQRSEPPVLDVSQKPTSLTVQPTRNLNAVPALVARTQASTVDDSDIIFVKEHPATNGTVTAHSADNSTSRVSHQNHSVAKRTGFIDASRERLAKAAPR
eukprot:TRINITY_DN12384_c0_g6_i1.p1 TRINITY_DN12384_c0_g6~~TRINITY_DN12384_c0_g6_i1.p1  ORF type:complete len:985 (+),score=230.84 TRINITY_DN12384_c0_g6_i1:75-2957(+)